MSRYNGPLHELLRLFRDLFFLFFLLPLYALGFTICYAIFGPQAGPEKWNRVVCWLTEHHWADNQKYGVEPVCLICNTHREDNR